MTHRAETIVATVETTITGLATTGSRVVRGRVDPLSADDANGLSLYTETEEIITRHLTGQVDVRLPVRIDIHARGATGSAVETALNAMREEITIAMLATEGLGLAYVIDVEEMTSAPELDGEAEQPFGLLRMQWDITYRRSRTNPGA